MLWLWNLVEKLRILSFNKYMNKDYRLPERDNSSP